MVQLVSLAIAIAMLAPAPLSIHVSPEPPSLAVGVVLEVPLPEVVVDTLPSGGIVRIIYPLSVRSHRTFWWDARIWKGRLTSQVAFDPITGRYRCELLLDEIVVATREVETVDEAVSWLTAPPPVRLVLKEVKNLDRLYLRARAVFSSSTTWLGVPDREGTDWVTIPVIPVSQPDAEAGDGDRPDSR